MSGIKVKNVSGTVGSYAISTVSFDSWGNEPVVPTGSKTKKIRNKEIINKIFSECAEVNKDPYWIERFNEAAVGKFPKKFSFKDGVLSFKKGTKYITMEVPVNPYLASEMCIDFFRNNGGLFSDMDKQTSLEIRCSSDSEITDLTWTDSNKKTQECMISYYIMDKKPEMSLTPEEVKQLRQTIYFGVSNKYFDKNNIIIEKNRIIEIRGLFWNSSERIFYIDPQLVPTTTRSYSRKKDLSQTETHQKDMIPQFYSKWKKYLESLENAKLNKSSSELSESQLTLDSQNEVMTKDDIDTEE